MEALLILACVAGGSIFGGGAAIPARAREFFILSHSTPPYSSRGQCGFSPRNELIMFGNDLAPAPASYAGCAYLYIICFP